MSFEEVDMKPVSDAKQVRVSVVQASTVFFDTSATIEKAEKFIAQAASEGSQVIVFPEAFIGGYPRGTTFGVKLGSRSPEGRELFRKYYQSAIEETSLETNHLANLSLKYNVFLVIGVIERDGGTLYCSVFFFDPSKGFVGKHRKLVPTAAERYLWGSGDGSTLTVVDSDVAKIGALICWENRMPLARTAMYAKGVEIYCAPTADARENWLSSITHIALEGSCFVLSANQFCRRSDYANAFSEFEFSSEEESRDPEANYVVCKGRSAIVSPFGEVLAGGLNFEEEGIISAYLDLGDIVRSKFEFDVVGHYSRSDIFSLTVKENANQGVKFFSASDHNPTP